MGRKRASSTDSNMTTTSHSPTKSLHSNPGGMQQRNAANARERARMRVLSKAFIKLKTHLPWVRSSHTDILSFVETLVFIDRTIFFRCLTIRNCQNWTHFVWRPVTFYIWLRYWITMNFRLSQWVARFQQRCLHRRCRLRRRTIPCRFKRRITS